MVSGISTINIRYHYGQRIVLLAGADTGKKINLLKISRFYQIFPDFYNVSPIFHKQKFSIKDKTTLFFKNKAEAFRKNYSIISAKYVHVKK